MNKVHELKSWPEFFQPIADGEQPFDLRKNDRDFKVRDVLILKEWDPLNKEYTGRVCKVVVTYIFPGGRFGLSDNFCILGVQRLFED